MVKYQHDKRKMEKAFSSIIVMLSFRTFFSSFFILGKADKLNLSFHGNFVEVRYHEE